MKRSKRNREFLFTLSLFELVTKENKFPESARAHYPMEGEGEGVGNATQLPMDVCRETWDKVREPTGGDSERRRQGDK